MSREALVRCVGCSSTNERLASRGRLAWWTLDVFAGVGVCRRCSQRANAEALRALVVLEGEKARALTATRDV